MNDNFSPISPLSSDFFHSEDVPPPLFSRSRQSGFSISTRTVSSIPDVQDGEARVSPTIKWGETDGINYWSDAFTASAVLTLLPKEPLQSPRRPAFDIRDEPEPNELITCCSCFERLGPQAFPQAAITRDCDHSLIPDMQICVACLRHSLDMQFSSESGSLSCPICHTDLSRGDIYRWASIDTFQAHETARTREALENRTEFITCVRKGCGMGQFHAPGRHGPVVTCGACGTRTCFVHRDIPYHEGLTCEEYDTMAHLRPNNFDWTGNQQRTGPGFMRRICVVRACQEARARRRNPSRPTRMNSTTEKLLSQQKIGEIAKPCPGCNAMTEKDGGIKHMQCPVCSQKWCWDCGNPWQPGHLDVQCVP